MKKLQWNTKHKTDFGNVVNFLETILLDNGIELEKIPGFLKPTVKYINDPFLMQNMEEGVKLLHKHLCDNSKIFVKVDPDVDGYCSGSMIIQFLQQLQPNVSITYNLDYEKKHGLTYDDIAGVSKDFFGLIIVPDASMTVKDARMIKENFSADILVLDHHLIEKETYDKVNGQWIPRNEAVEIYRTDKNRLDIDCYTKYCLPINCTDGQYPNNTLCGAGVVQKFIEAYTQTYAAQEAIPDCTQSFLDLVSLALIADNMDLRNLESRYYVMQGLKERNFNNEFVNALVERNKEEMKWGRNIISVGWNIAPKINGCIRYGSEQEQHDTFEALLGIQRKIEYQPKRKHKEDPKPPLEYHSLQETMARICENIKARQDTEVRKFVKEIDQQIEQQHLDKNSVLFIDGTKILDKPTVSGLIANKLASKYFRPVVLMRSKNATEYGGSMRGYANGIIKNTKEFLESLGITCMGHENAAGVLFKKDQLENIINKCNKELPLEILSTVYLVDWEIPAEQLRSSYVQQVAENYEVFGSTVPAPLFAIKDLSINAQDILCFGENQNFIRFTYNGVNFVKKYCVHDEYDNMTQKDRKTFGVNKKQLKLNIIGQFSLSAYDNKVTPEVIIQDFDSEVINYKAPTTTLGEDNWDEKIPVRTEFDELDFDW